MVLLAFSWRPVPEKQVEFIDSEGDNRWNRTPPATANNVQTSKQAQNVPMPQSQPTPQDTESISRDAIKAKQEEFEESIKRGERTGTHSPHRRYCSFAFGSVIVGYFQWRWRWSGQLTEVTNSSTDTDDQAEHEKPSL